LPVTAIGSRVVADAVEQPLAGAEHDRREMQAQLVEQPGVEAMAHRLGAAGDGDVPGTGRVAGLGEGRLEAVGDEGERRAALHGHRRALVVGETNTGAP
jgi:hypothetical protein